MLLHIILRRRRLKCKQEGDAIIDANKLDQGHENLTRRIFDERNAVNCGLAFKNNVLTLNHVSVQNHYFIMHDLFLFCFPSSSAVQKYLSREVKSVTLDYRKIVVERFQQGQQQSTL